MFKYSLEFRQNAIELVKKIGITKAAKELNVALGTVRRWCREMEGSTANEPEEPINQDIDALLEKQSEEPPPVYTLEEEPNAGGNDTIATAMAMLVIENAHLREVIKHLRDTISGLTDPILL